MSKYIIGIDGGGTKTLGALFDEEGKIILRVEYGFASFTISEETSKSNIEKTIDTLVTKIKDGDELIHIQLGIAGASKLLDKEDYLKYLSKKYNTSCDMVTDAEIALYSIKRDKDMNVIMVLGGTGSIIMLNDESGISIIGGFGHLLGDQGSSYHLSITALRNIIDEFEEGTEFSYLSKALLKEINAETHYEIKNFVYNSNKSTIAKLSLFVSKLALEGNEEAIELFIAEGKHLGRQAITAYKKIISDRKVIIGIKGGFLLRAPYVKETLIEELNKNDLNYEISRDQVEPVIGAYYLGLTKI